MDRHENIRDEREADFAAAIMSFYAMNEQTEQPDELVTTEVTVTGPDLELTLANWIVISPETFLNKDGKPDSRHRDDSIELRKLLREKGGAAELAPTAPGLLVQESFDSHLPAILISAQHLSSSPEAAKILLEVAKTYITDRVKNLAVFRGKSKLNITVVHVDGTAVRVEYEGSEAGLDGVAKAISAAAKPRK